MLSNLIRNGIASIVATANSANFAKEAEATNAPLAGLAALALAATAKPGANLDAAVQADARHNNTKSNDDPMQAGRCERIAEVLAQLDADPDLPRAMKTHCGIKDDAVIVTLAIRGQAPANW